jgi:hypothetical protein
MVNGFPFSTVDLHLKYIDFSKLDPLKRAALEFGFGRFFAEELPNDFARDFMTERHAALEQSGIRIETGAEAPFRYRRFAGDATLPRGRYFSVSDNPTGDDHGTLVHELISYTDHDKCGRFQVFDPAAPYAFADADTTLTLSEALPLSITLSFQHDENGSSPLVEHLVNRRLIARARTTHIEIPYEVRTEKLDRAIDLREPRSQAWLYECLHVGIPGLAFQYSDGRVSSTLSWAENHPKESDVDMELWLGGSKKLITYAPCDSWDGHYYGGPENFLGLLPYLIFPARGGSPITDFIGRWLRKNGATALIYPSARNDVECVVDNGVLTRATGWNLVDYRDAPTPHTEPCLIIGPDSWRFAGDALLHGDGTGGLKVLRYDVRVDRADSESAGTWRVADQARHGRLWFLGQQRMTAIGEQTRKALYASLTQANDETLGPERLVELTAIDRAKPPDLPCSVNDDDHGDLISHFASLIHEVQDAPTPRQRFEALLALRESLLEYPTTLAVDPLARAMIGDAAIEQLWRSMFTLGSNCLFSPQGDRERNVEEAVYWLSAAAALPIRMVNPVDWARTQGELATAYKNRSRGDVAKNRDDAMACLDRALDVFTPQRHRREWLITIKQRAVTRLETPEATLELARGETIERAVAELEFVAEEVDRKEDFALWSGTNIALGAAYTARELGYFVDNAERSRAVLEAVLAEAGDLETMMREGAELQRLQTAASAALSLARAYQVRRRGDPKANRERAVTLLKSARQFFAAINRSDAVHEIDDRLAGLQPET